MRAVEGITRHCIDCGKQITKNSKSGKCGSCAQKGKKWPVRKAIKCKECGRRIMFLSEDELCRICKQSLIFKDEKDLISMVNMVCDFGLEFLRRLHRQETDYPNLNVIEHKRIIRMLNSNINKIDVLYRFLGTGKLDIRLKQNV